MECGVDSTRGAQLRTTGLVLPSSSVAPQLVTVLPRQFVP